MGCIVDLDLNQHVSRSGFDSRLDLDPPIIITNPSSSGGVEAILCHLHHICDDMVIS